MKLRWRLAIAGVAAAAAACCLMAMRTDPCPQGGRACGGQANLLLVAATGLSLGLAAATVVWAGRAAWLLWQARRSVLALPLAEAPTPLAAGVRRTGLRAVVCLRGDTPASFCAGPLRPRVYVTDALVRELSPAELAAVLVHEGEHARRRDPLRRAARLALCETLFFLPVARWWLHRRLEAEELAADRAAVARVGAPAVAAALLTVGSTSGARPALAAFDGAADLRVAQLLGDPLPRRRPSPRILAMSVAGLAGAVSTALCAAGGMTLIR